MGDVLEQVRSVDCVEGFPPGNFEFYPFLPFARFFFGFNLLFKGIEDTLPGCIVAFIRHIIPEMKRKKATDPL